MNSNQPYGKQGDSSTEIGYPMCNANLNVKHKVSSVKPQSRRSGQLWPSELRMIVVKVRQTPSHEGHSSKVSAGQFIQAKSSGITTHPCELRHHL
jgi:hypothetical protein